ncbi:MAG: ROK family protein [Pseudonocardiaceae bacterium]
MTSASLTAGVDIGGTKVAAGVVNAHGTIVATTHRDTPADDVSRIENAIADSSMGTEQQAVAADAARTLWSLVEELSPRQRILLRALFTDHPRPYAEVARSARIPPGAIGPTRARALAQLRDRLIEHGLGLQPGDDHGGRVHTRYACLRPGGYHYPGNRQPRVCTFYF